MLFHVDFDSFFCACELARHPEIAPTQPLAVYGGEAADPMVLAATYAAKSAGVFTTQRLAAARALCPGLLCFAADLPYYRAKSAAAREFFAQQIPLIEQYSIDEFFGDLSGYISGEAAVREFALALQAKTAAKLGLAASIGASRSKWSAKLLTTLAKPAGVLVSADITPFLAGTPIEKFPGVGAVLSRRLKAHGIATLDAALARPELFCTRAERSTLARIAGTDAEPVIPDAPAKSLGASRSFAATSDGAAIREKVRQICAELLQNIWAQGRNPRTLTLALRSKTLRKSFRRRLELPFNYAQLRAHAAELATLAAAQRGVYSLSLSASDFASAAEVAQAAADGGGGLFADEQAAKKAAGRAKLNALLAQHPEWIK